MTYHAKKIRPASNKRDDLFFCSFSEEQTGGRTYNNDRDWLSLEFISWSVVHFCSYGVGSGRGAVDVFGRLRS